MRQKLRILVSGMVAGDPGQGGATWAVLQYVLGLRELGHEVLLIEPITTKQLADFSDRPAQSRQANYLRQVASHFDLQDQMCMVIQHSRESIGLPFESLRGFTSDCDLLINISGMLTHEELVADIPTRVYLDLDPTFNQLWHAEHGIDMGFDQHTHHFTVGHGIGTPDCPVPTGDIKWKKTLPPIVLRHWPKADQIHHNGLTTVANFRGYGSVEYQGEFYGQKVHSLREFYRLPSLTTEAFLLAMQVHPLEECDLQLINEYGWKLLDPSTLCATPWEYQAFLQGSKAEFGLAKSGYVKSRSGWFSDRSASYLASGRPVLAQATGFEKHLPVGSGLLSFETSDDVLNGIDSLNANYQAHADAARALAEDYFESTKVLNALIEAASS